MERIASSLAWMAYVESIFELTKGCDDLWRGNGSSAWLLEVAQSSMVDLSKTRSQTSIYGNLDAVTRAVVLCIGFSVDSSRSFLV
mmetsp:Transcript_11545/g.27790  ORF Transcript_11545/g.27790 Transcript_11545/m.27790 type:complete len:85 (-) Transcript_11545:54-308(-)